MDGPGHVFRSRQARYVNYRIAAGPVPLGVELEDDLVLAVGERERVAVVHVPRGCDGERRVRNDYGLGHDGRHLRRQIELELEMLVDVRFAFAESHPVGIVQGRDRLSVRPRIAVAADDRDVVQIVGQRLGEADDHVIGAVADTDPTERHDLVVAVIPDAVRRTGHLDAVTPAAEPAVRIDDRQGRFVDELLTLVEAESQLARRDAQGGPAFDEAAFLRDDEDQLRRDTQQHSIFELFQSKVTMLERRHLAADTATQVGSAA